MHSCKFDGPIQHASLFPVPGIEPEAMSIVENRKAFHDYFIEERFEAGLALEGWEVKAIRAGRANLK